MPIALKRKERDGTPYRRLPEIEASIEKLETIDAAVRLLQFEVVSRTHPEHVRTEALIYFLRRAWAEGENRHFEKVYCILFNRIDQSLRSSIWDSRIGSATDIRDEIAHRLVIMIAEDCKTQSDRLDFFEIRFDKAMVAIRTSVLRKFTAASCEVTIIPLGTPERDGSDISPEVELALTNFLGGDPQKIDDPAFRLVLFTAIDRLPPDQKQVIGLFLQGVPIDAKEKDVMTIARILKCDERTVRNRRDRAFKVLKAVLEEETEL
jgi:hypothetical protein